MKIIGLTGFAKSGKSTAAEILKGMGGKELAFAKHLKDVCSVVFNIPRDHFDDQAIKEVRFDFERTIQESDILQILNYFEISGRFVPETILRHKGVRLTSPRHVAQYIGTEMLRNIDSNIHINMAFKLNADAQTAFLICSDVRFYNELCAVKDGSGLMVGISRKAVVPADLQNLHPSEKEIPNLISKSNVIIENESTIEEFQNEVKDTMLEYLGFRRQNGTDTSSGLGSSNFTLNSSSK